MANSQQVCMKFVYGDHRYIFVVDFGFATYGPEHGEKGKKKYILIWKVKVFFFYYICSHFLFFMTRATALSHKINRIFELFAKYESVKNLRLLIRKMIPIP